MIGVVLFLKRPPFCFWYPSYNRPQTPHIDEQPRAKNLAEVPRPLLFLGSSFH